jgi:hypothetical protein
LAFSTLWTTKDLLMVPAYYSIDGPQKAKAEPGCSQPTGTLQQNL